MLRRNGRTRRQTVHTISLQVRTSSGSPQNDRQRVRTRSRLHHLRGLCNQTLNKITYSNQHKQSECFRLGKLSRCFCGHLIPNHKNSYFGKKFNTSCEKCPCKRFMFVPSRPEECGMYWLVRRKDFDVASWRPPCKSHFLYSDANITARNIVRVIPSGAKNAHAQTLPPTLPASPAMDLGKTMKCSTK